MNTVEKLKEAIRLLWEVEGDYCELHGCDEPCGSIKEEIHEEVGEFLREHGATNKEKPTFVAVRATDGNTMFEFPRKENALDFIDELGLEWDQYIIC